MIDIDDVIYLSGKLYIVRLVAATTYVMREYLGNKELGDYENLRHAQVELDHTLEFVGVWDEATSTINWSMSPEKLFVEGALPNNVITWKPSKVQERKMHNARIISDYKKKDVTW